MPIILPNGLTPQELRVLQEFRRLGTETATPAVLAAIKHPANGSGAPASLVAKGFLTLDAETYALTDRAKELLAYDPKPEFEEGAVTAEAAE